MGVRKGSPLASDSLLFKYPRNFLLKSAKEVRGFNSTKVIRPLLVQRLHQSLSFSKFLKLVSQSNFRVLFIGISFNTPLTTYSSRSFVFKNFPLAGDSPKNF